MKIVICDDDNKIIEELKPNIYIYFNTHRYDLVIDVFKSGESLILSPEKYDIIIMDYKMGKLNGMLGCEYHISSTFLLKSLLNTSYKNSIISIRSDDYFGNKIIRLYNGKGRGMAMFCYRVARDYVFSNQTYL